MRMAHGSTRMLSIVFGGLLIAALAAPARAQEWSSGFRARVWAGAVGRYVLKDNGTFTDIGLGSGLFALKVDGSAPAAGADGEYKLDRWLGLDAAVGYSRLNTQFAFGAFIGPQRLTGQLAIVPALLSLNIHVVTTQRVDFWVGPQIGYVIFPNQVSFFDEGRNLFTYKPKNVFSKKGFTTGADIGLTKKLGLNAAMRWQDADGDPDGHLTIDPTFVTVGLVWKP